MKSFIKMMVVALYGLLMLVSLEARAYQIIWEAPDIYNRGTGQFVPSYMMDASGLNATIMSDYGAKAYVHVEGVLKIVPDNNDTVSVLPVISKIQFKTKSINGGYVNIHISNALTKAIVGQTASPGQNTFYDVKLLTNTPYRVFVESQAIYNAAAATVGASSEIRFVLPQEVAIMNMNSTAQADGALSGTVGETSQCSGGINTTDAVVRDNNLSLVKASYNINANTTSNSLNVKIHKE